MQNVSTSKWINGFNKILFPLVKTLIQPDWKVTPAGAPPGTPKVPPPSSELEETRIRAMNLLTKVFLQHLNLLQTTPKTFQHVWLQILDFMDRYINIGRGESLAEAIPESLKNILLVMDTQEVFGKESSSVRKIYTEKEKPFDLWSITWRRISKFLPKLHGELYNIPDTPGTDLTVPVQHSVERSSERNRSQEGKAQFDNSLSTTTTTLMNNQVLLDHTNSVMRNIFFQTKISKVKFFKF